MTIDEFTGPISRLGWAPDGIPLGSLMNGTLLVGPAFIGAVTRSDCAWSAPISTMPNRIAAADAQRFISTSYDGGAGLRYFVSN
jgi:hypothetical protein